MTRGNTTTRQPERPRQATTLAQMAKTKMSDEHKAALAAGRRNGRIVRDYLEALESHKPKRGRKRTPESVQARLDKIDTLYDGADALTRLQLAQERIDLTAELDVMANKTRVDLASLETAFIEVAAEYAAAKGISYAAFRQMGVPAAALKIAGVARSR